MFKALFRHVKGEKREITRKSKSPPSEGRPKLNL